MWDESIDTVGNGLICTICANEIKHDSGFSVINHPGETGQLYHTDCLKEWFQTNKHGIVTREPVNSYLTYSSDNKLISTTYIVGNVNTYQIIDKLEAMNPTGISMEMRKNIAKRRLNTIKITFILITIFYWLISLACIVPIAALVNPWYLFLVLPFFAIIYGLILFWFVEKTRSIKKSIYN
jgi:hypothetical protein